MKPLLWIPLATFAFGFLCASLVLPAEDSAPPKDAPVAEDPRLPRTKAGRRAPSAWALVDARLARLLDDGEVWRPESTEDYRGMVTALQRRAGFSGLDSKGERLLRSIVVSWYDAEPDAALNWALSLGNPADEGVMMSAIVDHCAEDDWQAAVALAEQHGAAAGRSIFMPRRLAVEVMQTLSPEEFVRIDRLFSGTDPSFPSGMIRVGEDFQFAETLDLYGADKKPQVLLEEWARRDFGAVWEWADGRDEPQFKNDISIRTLAGIWAAQADDDQIAGFAAYLVGDAGPADAPDRNLEIAWRLLKERPASGVLASVLDLSPGDRQDQLNRLLRIGATNLKFGKENEMVRDKLLGQMTTEERLTAFESNRNANGWSGSLYEEPLIRLGYSPEEIERMLPE